MNDHVRTGIREFTYKPFGISFAGISLKESCIIVQMKLLSKNVGIGPAREKKVDEATSDSASNQTLCAAQLSDCNSFGSPVTKGCCTKMFQEIKFTKPYQHTLGATGTSLATIQN